MRATDETEKIWRRNRFPLRWGLRGLIWIYNNKYNCRSNHISAVEGGGGSGEQIYYFHSCGLTVSFCIHSWPDRQNRSSKLDQNHDPHRYMDDLGDTFGCFHRKISWLSSFLCNWSEKSYCQKWKLNAKYERQRTACESMLLVCKWDFHTKIVYLNSYILNNKGQSEAAMTQVLWYWVCTVRQTVTFTACADQGNGQCSLIKRNDLARNTQYWFMCLIPAANRR